MPVPCGYRDDATADFLELREQFGVHVAYRGWGMQRRSIVREWGQVRFQMPA